MLLHSGRVLPCLDAVGIAKGLPAGLAHEGPRAGVSHTMLLQVAGRQEAFPTCLTHARGAVQARVRLQVCRARDPWRQKLIKANAVEISYR